MSRRGHFLSRIWGLKWLSESRQLAQRAGKVLGRYRRDERIGMRLDHLEVRTLLSVSAINGLLPSLAATTEDTLNLQLEPGYAGAISVVTPLITAAGGVSPRRPSRGCMSSRFPPRTWGNSPLSSHPIRPSNMPTRHKSSRT